MKSLTKFDRSSSVGVHVMKVANSMKRVVSLLTMVFVIVLFALGISSVRPADGATAVAKDCDVSPTFNVPAELTGDQPLRVRDGEYPIGQWQSSEALVEIRVAVSRGQKTDVVLAVGGKRLKEGPRSKEDERCVRSHGLALAMDRRNPIQEVVNLITPTAYAGSKCKSADTFKVAHSGIGRYALIGGAVYCSSYTP